MATGTMEYHQRNDFRYGFYIRGRKIARKSKPMQGITVKKREISSHSDDEFLGFKEEKKRNLQSHNSAAAADFVVSSTRVINKSQESLGLKSVVNDSLQKEPSSNSRNSSPESWEIISDDSKKRRKTELPSNSRNSSPESGEIISDDSKIRRKTEPPSNSRNSSPESGEIISDDSKKRRKTEESVRVIYKSRDVISGCGSVDEYEILNPISHGAYGIVYRARDKKTGEIVAMKEEFDGLSIPSLREINILKSLHLHPSIVELKQVVVDDYDGVYVVMEYLETDLKRYMDFRKTYFSLGQVKRLMKQLLEGIKFLHDNRVMHRDLKPSNILMNNRGKLKICDFGLSRHFGSEFGFYSPNVVTLWYRAPELLLGAKSYSSAIDMWSIGCIMAELLWKEVIFKGQSEIDQLVKIYQILGTPNEAVWPGFLSLLGSSAKFVKQPYNLLKHKFLTAAAENFVGVPVLTEAGFDLLNRLLMYDPAKRITAQSALSHAWFQELSS